MQITSALQILGLMALAYALPSTQVAPFDKSSSPLLRDRLSVKIDSISGVLNLAMPIMFVVMIAVSFVLDAENKDASDRVANEEQEQYEAQAQASWKQTLNSPGYKEQIEAENRSAVTGRNVLYSTLELSDVISNTPSNGILTTT